MAGFDLPQSLSAESWNGKAGGLDKSKSAAKATLAKDLSQLQSLNKGVRWNLLEIDKLGSAKEMGDRLAEIDLLHVDDLGAEKSSPWVLEQLYAIVNARYEGERSMVITTNLDRPALVEQITERTVSRLEEMCDVIPLHGADHRQVVGRRAS